MRKRMVLCSLLDKPSKPTKEDPDDRAAYDSRKIRRLVNTVRIRRLIKEDTRDNLER